MAKNSLLVRKVIQRRPAWDSDVNVPNVSFDVETATGPMELQFTSEAAAELKALLVQPVHSMRSPGGPLQLK